MTTKPRRSSASAIARASLTGLRRRASLYAALPITSATRCSPETFSERCAAAVAGASRIRLSRRIRRKAPPLFGARRIYAGILRQAGDGGKCGAAQAPMALCTCRGLLDLVARQLQVEVGLHRHPLARSQPALVLHRALEVVGVPDGERARAVHPLELLRVAARARGRTPALLHHDFDRGEAAGGNLDHLLADDRALRLADERAAAAGVRALDVAERFAERHFLELRQVGGEHRNALRDEVAA